MRYELYFEHPQPFTLGAARSHHSCALIIDDCRCDDEYLLNRMICKMDDVIDTIIQKSFFLEARCNSDMMQPLLDNVIGRGFVNARIIRVW